VRPEAVFLSLHTYYYPLFSSPLRAIFTQKLSVFSCLCLCFCFYTTIIPSIQGKSRYHCFLVPPFSSRSTSISPPSPQPSLILSSFDSCQVEPRPILPIQTFGRSNPAHYQPRFRVISINFRGTNLDPAKHIRSVRVTYTHISTSVEESLRSHWWLRVWIPRRFTSVST
jgi:hypothetical protein